MDGDKPEKPSGLDAPGLIYRRRRDGWTLSWSPQSDLTARGYPGKTVKLWPPSNLGMPRSKPTSEEWTAIGAWCVRYQAEMRLWAQGGRPNDPQSVFDGTIGSLIEIYQRHKKSPFQKLRYEASNTYAGRLRALKETIGRVNVKSITFEKVTEWQDEFADPGDGSRPLKARATALIWTLKTICLFGSLVLPKSAGCHDVCDIFVRMAQAKMMGGSNRQRKEYMTAAQCRLLRAKAHELGKHSIAMEQAFAFELGLRQKDVIGEWVPLAWPALPTAVHWGPRKWIMGIRWEEIDSNLILTHRLSKSVRGRSSVMDVEEGKVKVWDLTTCPMIMEELQWFINYGQSLKRQSGTTGHQDGSGNGCFENLMNITVITSNMIRSLLPASGPLIVSEQIGRPWTASAFRQMWRKVATTAGVPVTIQNRDSRPGAATEADMAGAPIEKTQRMLGHSKRETTGIYLREELEAQREMARLRTEGRK